MKRLLFLQYGDFADAFRRLKAGGVETYRDQRHSVDYAETLASQYNITVIGVCDRSHDEALSPTLRSVGMPVRQAYSKDILTKIHNANPDIFICRTPHTQALTWSARRKIPVLPVFADVIQARTMRERWQNWQLAVALKRCNAVAVANHSLSASESLELLGIPRNRIIPWEFKQLSAMENHKTLPLGETFALFYAGMVTEEKGVGDLLRAVAICVGQSVPIRLTIAGPGEIESWSSFANDLGIAPFVRFLGRVATDEVLAQMRSHDAVVVPSRHSYAEGLPNTIFEAFASRSPLIASDHPAFVQRLKSGVNFLSFPAGNSHELAARIKILHKDPELYERLSSESQEALASLYCGIEWADLVELYLSDPENTSNWVSRISLASDSEHRK